jgi:hypothetical protein
MQTPLLGQIIGVASAAAIAAGTMRKNRPSGVFLQTAGLMGLWIAHRLGFSF